MPEPILDSDFVVRWISELQELVVDAEETLTELDAAIGDADHGSNMTRGLRAAVAVLDEAKTAPPASLLNHIGEALTRSIGGASGPLFGTIFTAMARTLPATPRISAQDLASGLREGLRSVHELGAAVVGDKTMIDAIAPAVAEMEEQLGEGVSVGRAASAAAKAAEEGVIATIPLRARKGRASYLGPRSEGHQDPGATSSALLFKALSAVIPA